MKVHKVDYSKISNLAKTDLAYLHLDPKLDEFYQYVPAIESFEQTMMDRKKFPVNREVLVQVLEEQYQDINEKELALSQIISLEKDNTFTVITAHQPSLITGPLYFIYKICSAINLSKALNQRYSSSHIVPVFILGAEDHDFEEINHLNIYGKRVEWERDSSGSVGRLDLSELDKVLDKVYTILGQSENADEIKQKIGAAYTSSLNYADFTFKFLHSIFGQYGLVIINMDSSLLKRQMADIFKEELLNQPSIDIVNDTIQSLANLGFKTQASPREINLFYLQDTSRERIVLEDGQYSVINTELSFTESEIMEELANFPERFSPNVVLRPLYQESILPNLAYIGGGGELAYWLERKAQFAYFNVFYPMLIRRNSALIIPRNLSKIITQYQIEIPSLFLEEHELIKNFVIESETDDFQLTNESVKIDEILEGIAAKAKAVEQPLEKYVLAEKTKILKTIEQIEQKIYKAQKASKETDINRLSTLKNKLFPNGGLQERHDNFLPSYSSNGSELLKFLIENLDPLDRRFCIFEE